MIFRVTLKVMNFETIELELRIQRAFFIQNYFVSFDKES